MVNDWKRKLKSCFSMGMRMLNVWRHEKNAPDKFIFFCGQKVYHICKVQETKPRKENHLKVTIILCINTTLSEAIVLWININIAGAVFPKQQMDGEYFHVKSHILHECVILPVYRVYHNQFCNIQKVHTVHFLCMTNDGNTLWLFFHSNPWQFMC